MILFALLPLLLIAGAAFGAPNDADGGRAYAREQLVREARRIVRPEAMIATDLDAIKAALAEDMRLRAGWKATSDGDRALLKTWDATIDARKLLLGEPQGMAEDGQPIPATEGALQQARLLLRWIRADTPAHQGCGVIVLDPRAPREADREREFVYPTLPPGRPAAATPGVPAPSGPPATPAANEPPARAPGPGSAETPSGDSSQPKPSAAPEAPAPSAVAAPLSVDDWARAVRTSLGSTLLGKQIRPAVCDDVSWLVQAERTPTPIQEPALRSLKLRRRALEAAEPFAYNAAQVALRRLQASERVEAIRADRPAPGLVDDGTVREKVQRAEDFAEGLKVLEQLNEDLLLRLDEMVTDLDSWKTMAAILAMRIEDRSAKLSTEAPPVEGAAPRPPDLELRVLSAQESVVSLEMRLLYLAVVRSDVRLGLLKDGSPTAGLLDQLIQAARDEVATAQASRMLYEDELSRVRRERRLDRLQSEARPLMARIEAMSSAEEVGAEQALRRKAYESLLTVNGIAQEAVRRRRELGDWALQLPPKAPAGVSADDPLAFARDPRSSVWDAVTLQRWREMLVRPEFDEALVAEHYATADSRLRRLRDTLRAGVDAAPLRLRFDAAAATADRALAPLVERRDWVVRTYRLPDLLEAWRRDFDDSLDGMQKERERIAERQVLVREYQETLLDLGPRSFGIRVSQDLNREDLSGAAADTLAGLESARKWIGLEDPDRNLWQFTQDHWLALLCIACTLLVLLMGVPRARRRIDRWLARRAALYPQLEWAGASVSQEREDAKARKELEDALAAARAAELLRAVEADSKGGSEAPPVLAVAVAAPSAIPTQIDVADPAEDPDGSPKMPDLEERS